MSAPSLPPPPARQRFRRTLLAWYRAARTRSALAPHGDPYHILVSEMMLQQTQVDRVLPKYHEWLEKYPSLEALAAAPPKTTSQRRGGRSATTSGRGACTRSRASRSRATAASFRPMKKRCCRSRASARTPPARFAASRSGERAAILDTNVARVLFRVFVRRGDPKAHAMRKHLWAISETLVPHKHVFDFNQALMDLGATVCVARKPKCHVCPMTKLCRSYPWRETKSRR